MRRIGTWTAAMVLGAGALAGCGGDDSSGGGDEAGGDTGSYCETLEGFRDTLQNLTSAAGIREFEDAADELADQAPDEVSAEWKQMKDAFDSLDDKLEEQGLTLEDLENPTPSAEQQEKLTAIQEEMSTLGEDLDSAGKTITEHAKSECDLDLDGESTPEDSASPSS